jgi:hypothetical protein
LRPSLPAGLSAATGAVIGASNGMFLSVSQFVTEGMKKLGFQTSEVCSAG